MNIISLSIIVIIATIIALAGSSVAVTTFAQDINNGKDLLLGECAGTPQPMPPFMPGEFTGVTNTTLVFLYEKGGGFAPVLSSERISYDSLTKQLVSISALKPPEIKILTGPEQHCLEQLIVGGGFFEANSDYPPVKGAADFFTHSLGIILGNKTHNVSWTDVSEGVPEGIIKIVKEIRDLAAR
jgi:hypothetical protein